MGQGTTLSNVIENNKGVKKINVGKISNRGHMFILASDSFLEERKLSLNPLKLVLHSVEYTVYTLHSIHMHFMQTMKGVEIAVLPSLHHYNLFYSCTWPSYLMDLLSLRLVGGVGAIGVI